MNRWVGALAFAAVSSIATAASAQEIQISGPLAGAPSCRRCVLYRERRFEVSPTFGVTLQDDFDRALVFGVNAQYHITDILGIGGWFGFSPSAIHVATPLTSAIVNHAAGTANHTTSSLNIPDSANFTNQVGQIYWMLSLPQITLVPLRGKLALFQNVFVDADLYLFAGLGIFGIGQRPDQEQALTTDPTSLSTGDRGRQNQLRVTGTFGAGLNFYINRYLSVAVEYRAFPFAWNTSGTDENSRANTCGADGLSSCQGFPDYVVRRDATYNPPANGFNRGGSFVIDGADNAFRWNQMVNFAFNIYLPTAPRISN